MTVNQDEYWMHVALKYAHLAKDKGEIPIGAILVLNKKIIGIGWNKCIIKNDPTAHAEIVALRQAGKIIKNYRLKNTTLYVTLQPCTMCFGAIIHSRIKRLVFGANYKKTDQKYSFKNIFLELQKKCKLQVQSNVLEYQCSRLLTSFFRNKRK